MQELIDFLTSITSLSSEESKTDWDDMLKLYNVYLDSPSMELFAQYAFNLKIMHPDKVKELKLTEELWMWLQIYFGSLLSNKHWQQLIIFTANIGYL